MNIKETKKDLEDFFANLNKEAYSIVDEYEEEIEKKRISNISNFHSGNGK